jgi:hypothetical protein
MGGGVDQITNRSLVGLLSRSMVWPTRFWYSSYYSGLNRGSTLPASNWMS